MLTLSENGYGKRSSAYEYRVTGRGGKGITAMVTNDRNGKLVTAFPVEQHDQLMLITDRGQTIRVPVDGIPHCRALDPGRDRLQHRRRRAGRLSRAYRG